MLGNANELIHGAEEDIKRHAQRVCPFMRIEKESQTVKRFERISEISLKITEMLGLQRNMQNNQGKIAEIIPRVTKMHCFIM